MRRMFLIAGLLAAFGLAVLAVGAQTHPNFGGTWALDKAKSQGLSQRMQGADSVTWTITDDGKTISIDPKVTGAPAGGGGGTGGGRGPGGPPPVYNLNGTETASDINFGQMTGKATSKATWSGATLELLRKSVVNGPNGEVTNTTSQKLSLSGDGKVLTAVVHSEGARGTQDSTLVFNKQ
jgi:hypothetical protein